MDGFFKSMSKVYFVSAEISTPKQVSFFSGEKIVKTNSLALKEIEVEIKEFPLIIQVSYSKNIWKKILGIILYFIAGLGGATRDEIFQLLYIDILKIREVGDDVSVKYLGSKELFLVSNVVEVEIKRYIDIRDFILVAILFFIPIFVFLIWMIAVFILLMMPIVIKLICISILFSILLYSVFIFFSLYKKTK